MYNVPVAFEDVEISCHHVSVGVEFLMYPEVTKTSLFLFGGRLVAQNDKLSSSDTFTVPMLSN